MKVNKKTETDSDCRFNTLKKELDRLVKLNARAKKLEREVSKLKEELDEKAMEQGLKVLQILATVNSDEDMPDLTIWHYPVRDLKVIFRFPQGKESGQLLLLTYDEGLIQKVKSVDKLWTADKPGTITTLTNMGFRQNDLDSVMRQIAWLDPSKEHSMVGMLKDLCERSEQAFTKHSESKERLLLSMVRLEVTSPQ